MSKIIEEIERTQIKKDIPDFRVGDTVKVHLKIIEGDKERIQIYEGIVIKRQGIKARETFTVRKIVQSVGVEKTFPVNSKMISRIQVIRTGKVRRAKLYYLRKRIGSAATKIEEAGTREENKS
jgi:large subunit ribosomal protein L19